MSFSLKALKYISFNTFFFLERSSFFWSFDTLTILFWTDCCLCTPFNGDETFEAGVKSKMLDSSFRGYSLIN